MESELTKSVFGILTEAANVNTEPETTTGLMTADTKTSNVTQHVTVETTDPPGEPSFEEEDRRLRRELVIDTVQRNLKMNRRRSRTGNREDYVLHKLARSLGGPVVYVSAQQSVNET